MSGVVGVEVSGRALRAVRLGGWPPRPVEAAEVEWNPASPAAGVIALGEKLGTGARVVLAFDLPLLFVKRLKLPPVPAAEKRRMVSLEPDRFFPVRGGEEMTVVLRDGDTLAFAASEERLAEWIAALAALGPLDYVEPAPVALARALSTAGILNATVLMDRDEAGCIIAEIADGRLRDARRVPGCALTAASRFANEAPDAAGRRLLYLDPWNAERAEAVMREHISLDIHPLPPVNGLASSSLVALGAALGAGGALEAALAPDAALRQIRARRSRPRFAAAAACLAALAFAIWSADYSRTRTERSLDSELRALSDRASSTLALETETRRLAQEERVLARAEVERPRQLATLLAVSVRLPADAHVLMLRASGREWQLDGVAVNAARLIPALEAHERLEGVRFLEATRRAERRGEIRENFSLAFRAARAP
ncbi:MAG: hypothetical protein M3365_07140 [Gemmatimonadota bacterium]|nr:hypothetical protein [Gemmatimonadota bacterium]